MNKLAKAVSAAILSIAKASSGAACEWLTYQPKVPKALAGLCEKKKKK